MELADGKPLPTIADNNAAHTKPKTKKDATPKMDAKPKKGAQDKLAPGDEAAAEGEEDEPHPPRGPRERRRQTNTRFEAYYRACLVDTGLVKEEDWEGFIDSLNRPLPCTLWINSTATEAEEVRTFLRQCQIRAEAAESGGVDAGVAAAAGDDQQNPDSGSAERLRVCPLSWIPDDMGWCVDVPKAVLRKHPTFKPLHQFLIKHTAQGTITRQEEVSMLPVVALGIAAGHRCLDMCAAPGSKTAQMCAALGAANFAKFGRGLEDHCSEEVKKCRSVLRGRVDYSSDEGLVVANDMDNDRIGMLVHQVGRLRSLFPLALFTYHDARFFPSVRTPDGTELRYDRILCDVMCSSDGTLRKEPHMWRRWNIKASLELHKDQLAVALRAARLLKVGGRMVYSTCSMSPAENEAVVAELLRCTHGNLRLVDARDAVEPFHAAPGLTKWKIPHPRTNTLHSTYAEALEKDGPKTILLPGHFPPDDANTIAVLPRCLRVLPHHNDTGGFFLALFEKVSELRGPPYPTRPEEPSRKDPVPDPRPYDSDVDPDGEEAHRHAQLERLEDAIVNGKSEQERAKALSRRERANKSGILARELVRYVPFPDAASASEAPLRETYGMADSYGSNIAGFPLRQLFCRYHIDLDEDGTVSQPHTGGAKQLVFCARAVADLLPAGTGPHAKRLLKVMGGGLRTFQKDNFEVVQVSHYRIAHEMVELLLPYLRSRVIELADTLDDTKRLLLDKLKSAPVDALASPGRERLQAISPGGCVLLLYTSIGDRIAVPALRTRNAVTVYVDNNELPILRHACGIEEPEIEDTDDRTSAAKKTDGIENDLA